MDEDLPKGFDCECGEHHVYPLYVFAHWTDELVFSCDICKRTYTIQYGEAEER